jgi:hypothetical protein
MLGVASLVILNDNILCFLILNVVIFIVFILRVIKLSVVLLC